MVTRLVELAACFLSRCSKLYIEVGLNDASKALPRFQELLSTDHTMTDWWELEGTSGDLLLHPLC